MRRDISLTVRLNEREYTMLEDLQIKFNSNKKINKDFAKSDLIRTFILWEHERLIQHKT